MRGMWGRQVHVVLFPSHLPPLHATPLTSPKVMSHTAQSVSVRAALRLQDLGRLSGTDLCLC